MTQRIIKALPTLLFSLALALSVPPAQAAMQRPRAGTPPEERQDGRGPKQFSEDLKRFISREAQFTPEEARAFFPVFFEMREKQRNLERQCRNALHMAAEKNMNERDCQRILEEQDRLSKKAQRIEAQYRERLRRLVGAHKLVKALDADNKFGRCAFKQMIRKPK